jgi:hypothetical protein
VQSHPPNTAALSAVLRIKAGLCPFERLEDITVDFRNHAPFLDQFLSSDTRLGIVLGPYGTGKTHFLQLTRKNALSEKFAVAHLGLDTGLSSLNHPQRHVLTIFRSLTLPAPYGFFAEWMGTMLDDPMHARHLEESFIELRADCPSVVDAALWIMRQADKTLRSTLLLEYLSGALLVAKTAHSSSRLRAYELVRFWSTFCTRILGVKGLVLLIDELENLFSNALYWSILSRRSAYRTLSFYTESLQSAKTLCALTPEGLKLFRVEIQNLSAGLLGDLQQVSGEKFTEFLGRVEKTRVHELSPFGQEQYRMLHLRLAALHAEARGYPNQTSGRLAATSLTGPGITPRIFAKSVLSALERDWFTRKSQTSREE